jgi:hypothetical protein
MSAQISPALCTSLLGPPSWNMIWFGNRSPAWMWRKLKPFLLMSRVYGARRMPK